MTIVQIAGTSGSGKSHLMRSFLAWAKAEGAVIFEEEMEGRAAPVGYHLKVKGVKPPLYVCGAYETPTGGCDTFKRPEQAFDLVKAKHGLGHHVLFEGLFCMNQQRGPALAAEVGRDLCILQLTTPLATCLASINIRRAERGEEVLANKSNTVNNYKRAENYCMRMRDAAARVFRVSRDDGLDKILELLGVQ